MIQSFDEYLALSLSLMCDSLNLVLLTCSTELDSLNHSSLSDYSISSQFSKAASVQNSCFDLSVFREYTCVVSHLKFCSDIVFLFYSLKDHLQIH